MVSPPLSSPTQEREHDSEDEDEDKYADDVDMPGQNFDSKRRITVRNLRIREDIAKVTAVLPPKIGLFRCVCVCARCPSSFAGVEPERWMLTVLCCLFVLFAST